MDDVLPPGLSPLQSIDQVDRGLSAAGYIANRQISTAIYMAHHLQKPILVEGPAGVGKTELAKSVASWMKLPLIRMQCYEGLDESKALYEWKYGKQLLYTQILKDKISSVIGDSDNLATSLDKLHAFGDIFFSKQFLEPRPLLRALEEPGGAVLLIDEIEIGSGVRGLPAGNPFRLPGHHPGNRHRRRDCAADRAADVEFHPRSGRRAETPLLASAYRLPG